METGQRFETQRLDHLGIVAGISQKIGLIEAIDQQVGAVQCKISCGQAVQAMVLNALGFSSRALYLMPDYLRSSQTGRNQQVGLRAADFYRQRPEAPLDEHPDPEPGLLAALEAHEDIRRLQTLLAQLNEEKQELLRLRFAAGLGFAEIALLEGKSEAAVKMSLYRTLNWLREHWEAENG